MTSLVRCGLLAYALLVASMAGIAGEVAKPYEYHSYLYFQPVVIQGQLFSLMVDTGSTFTVLKKKDLDRIPDKQLLEPVRPWIANGTRVEMQRYLIPQVQIENCLPIDIQVLEAPPGAVYNLLGMQALVQLEAYTFDRGILSVTCHARAASISKPML